MIRQIAAVALILALVACAKSETNIYGGLVGQQVVGNAAYVTVSNVWSEMDALPLADRHCAQHGRVARFQQMMGARATFECVDA